MTKKSQARLARDAYKNSAENNCWDSLNEIHGACVTSITEANNNLVAVYGVDGVIATIPDKVNVKIAMKGLTQDLSGFSTELAGIHALHSDRTGGFKDQDDFILSIGIFEKYKDYQMRYDALILPNAEFLLEQAGLAFNALQRIAAGLPPEEQDPTVVTDVEVKTTEPVTVETAIEAVAIEEKA